ncbi:DUF6087 family protein [Streptomyces sp. NPDC050508]|uniref:DUF6087 family protein n=1 Tax=Streptomyces sp. NPDC050508 TaxID=3155405 RepID=UPI00341DD560
MDDEPLKDWAERRDAKIGWLRAVPVVSGDGPRASHLHPEATAILSPQASQAPGAQVIQRRRLRGRSFAGPVIHRNPVTARHWASDESGCVAAGHRDAGCTRGVGDCRDVISGRRSSADRGLRPSPRTLRSPTRPSAPPATWWWCSWRCRERTSARRHAAADRQADRRTVL